MASSLKRRIAVAMSGGVDSAVAAYLLKQRVELSQMSTSSASAPEGATPKEELVGLHMSNWDVHDDDEAGKGGAENVCHEQDAKDAQAVCRHLGIPLSRVSFAPEYWTQVFEPFLEDLSRGKTPNPDVGCNLYIKFGAMKQYAMQNLGADCIATGHYARLWSRDSSSSFTSSADTVAGNSFHASISDSNEWIHDWGSPDTPLLIAAADKSKDQSYFLASTPGSAFRNVLFPLGDLQKQSQVRPLAVDAELPNASKRESMGICFIGKRRFGSFLNQYLVDRPGNFVDIDTLEIVGEHRGVLQYTIGQGAKVSGAAQKWFVAGRNGDDIEICRGTHHPALYADQIYLDDVSWVGEALPPPLRGSGSSMSVQCRTRHLQPLVDCTIHRGTSGYTVHFHRPVRALTPGQMAVFYVGDLCLGGGVIEDRGASFHQQGLSLPFDLHPAGHNDLSVAV